MIFCSKCGGKLASEDKFCHKCGDRTKDETEAKKTNTNFLFKKVSLKTAGITIAILIILFFTLLYYNNNLKEEKDREWLECWNKCGTSFKDCEESTAEERTWVSSRKDSRKGLETF